MRVLLDEMFPAEAARILREDHDHDAHHVAEIGLGGAEDAAIAQLARAEDRALVTENVADFVREADLVVVFVLKRNLPAGGGQAAALAELLDRWAAAHDRPYKGQHWPQ